MFIDRPQRPLETAMWWTNFVLRHSKEDLSTLRPLIVGRHWWIKRQLDVWALVFVFILAMLTIIGYALYVVIKCAYRLQKSTKVSTERKKIQ